MSPPESLPTRDILLRILELLEELKEDNRATRRMLQAQRGNGGNTLSFIPDGFPLKTVREVEEMEEKLSDPSFMSDLITAVADIGGSTVDEATRRMMVFIMDHDLSRLYNFVGRNGKREFRSLKLFEVIFGALKKNSLTSQITRKNVERAVHPYNISRYERQALEKYIVTSKESAISTASGNVKSLVCAVLSSRSLSSLLFTP
ncbi:uncharacterized protein V3H82_005380 [Fundulus diaphanus]